MRWLAASRFLLFLSTCTAAVEAQSAAATPAPRIVLLELFTSEGCSSCPPADALLRELNGSKTSTGAEIIGISEHVTYWDYLGWHDRYDKPVFDQRQQAYSTRFGKDGVYTPQLVVNGEAEMVGSNRAAVERALARPVPQSSLHVSITSAVVDGNHLNLGYRVTGNIAGDTELYAAIVQDAIPAKVTRGENSGATLAHASVARAFARIATLHGPADGKVALPKAMLANGTGSPPVRLILLAQKAGLGPILSIDTAPLQTATVQADLR